MTEEKKGGNTISTYPSVFTAVGAQLACGLQSTRFIGCGELYVRIIVREWNIRRTAHSCVAGPDAKDQDTSGQPANLIFKTVTVPKTPTSHDLSSEENSKYHIT